MTIPPPSDPPDAAAPDGQPLPPGGAAIAPLPVVALGASAGGLDAFREFFRHMPATSGMGFVLVAHFDPDHPSLLVDLLKSATAMPVVEAEDGMAVLPDRVHVIAPNRDMVISEGVLHLSLPDAPRGHRMPIDRFMRSLAVDQAEAAIGIVLSGTGSDGTLGLREITGLGGLTLVQDPATASFEGMPGSAIRAGYAAHVLPVERMPACLLAELRKPARRAAHLPAGAPPQGQALDRLLNVLRSFTGHDFSRYKKTTVGRRVARRMAHCNIENVDIYTRYVKEHPVEAQALFRELLINVTSFFRNPEAFQVLQREILPQMVVGKPGDYVFRVWVAGCSTGEEAYSIAIVMREFLLEAHSSARVQIFATDLDDDAIATARAATYPPNIAADLSPERLQRFFVPEGSGYRLCKEIREMVVFAVQDIIQDPPFTKLDLVSCRNVMIYLEAELQHGLVAEFSCALKPGGVLFLSPSEGVGRHTDLFTPMDSRWKFYRSIGRPLAARQMVATALPWARPVTPPGADPAHPRHKEVNLADLTRRALVQAYAPPSVLTDMQGNVLFVHGDLGDWLRPAPGHASLNVVSMAYEGLQGDLLGAVRAAAGGVSTLDQETTVNAGDGARPLSLSARPVKDAEGTDSFILLSFCPATGDASARPRRGRRRASSPGARRAEELEGLLAHTTESLQATIEEQQASYEELQSANEELQSTNEEVRSTNEELETSKEELQSLNEELSTVNAELQAKVELLVATQNDMKNLLDNVGVGTIFLDARMQIRRFTREATRLYPLVESDVGRALADIKSEIDDDTLLTEAAGVLTTLIPREREVRTRSGLWYRARAEPYRTLDDTIEGVVLAFTDITARVDAEAAMAEVRALAEALMETVQEPVLVLDGALKVVSASAAYGRVFGQAPGSLAGTSLHELGGGLWSDPALAQKLARGFGPGEDFQGLRVHAVVPGLGPRLFDLAARRLVSAREARVLILLTFADRGPAAAP